LVDNYEGEISRKGEKFMPAGTKSASAKVPARKPASAPAKPIQTVADYDNQNLQVLIKRTKEGMANGMPLHKAINGALQSMQYEQLIGDHQPTREWLIKSAKAQLMNVQEQIKHDAIVGDGETTTKHKEKIKVGEFASVNMAYLSQELGNNVSAEELEGIVTSIDEKVPGAGRLVDVRLNVGLNSNIVKSFNEQWLDAGRLTPEKLAIIRERSQMTVKRIWTQGGTKIVQPNINQTIVPPNREQDRGI